MIQRASSLSVGVVGGWEPSARHSQSAERKASYWAQTGENNTAAGSLQALKARKCSLSRQWVRRSNIFQLTHCFCASSETSLNSGWAWKEKQTEASQCFQTEHKVNFRGSTAARDVQAETDSLTVERTHRQETLYMSWEYFSLKWRDFVLLLRLDESAPRMSLREKRTKKKWGEIERSGVFFAEFSMWRCYTETLLTRPVSYELCQPTAPPSQRLTGDVTTK